MNRGQRIPIVCSIMIILLIMPVSYVNAETPKLIVEGENHPILGKSYQYTVRIEGDFKSCTLNLASESGQPVAAIAFLSDKTRSYSFENIYAPTYYKAGIKYTEKYRCNDMIGEITIIPVKLETSVSKKDSKTQTSALPSNLDDVKKRKYALDRLWYKLNDQYNPNKLQGSLKLDQIRYDIENKQLAISIVDDEIKNTIREFSTLGQYDEYYLQRLDSLLNQYEKLLKDIEKLLERAKNLGTTKATTLEEYQKIHKDLINEYQKQSQRYSELVRKMYDGNKYSTTVRQNLEKSNLQLRDISSTLDIMDKYLASTKAYSGGITSQASLLNELDKSAKAVKKSLEQISKMLDGVEKAKKL